jgi:hypothetical protein
VRAYPNISSVDLTRIREAIGRVNRAREQALRFLGLFTAAAGVIVLAGALGTSRWQRARARCCARWARAAIRCASCCSPSTSRWGRWRRSGLVLSMLAAAALSRGCSRVTYLPDALRWSPSGPASP